MINFDWFTGFAESEGTFSFCICRTNYTIGWRIQPYFKVNVAESDRTALEKLQAFLLSHNIIAHLNFNPKHKRWSRNASNQYRLDIYRLDNCIKLANILLKRIHLPTKKRQVEIWAKILKQLKEKHPLNNREKFLQIIEEIDNLNSLRKSRGRRKYSKLFFERLWELNVIGRLSYEENG